MMFRRYGRDGKDIEQEHFVFTLRSQQKEWRKIDVTGDSYTDVQGGICIEKVEFIKTQKDEIVNVYSWTFINHQGKLGGIEYNYFYKMRLWMQEERNIGII
ncbi:putative F-box associated domain, type 3 [Arabidopsis thaliana]